MFLRDHQEHFTRAELAFAFARADSLARNIPITDISSIIYGLPGVGGPPQLPEIDVLGPTRESKPAEKTSSPHLHSTTKGDSPFVYALIEAHLTSWYGLVNHRFAKKMADGTASLDQFRYYMVQDMLYLQGWVRDKMTGAAQADFSTLETVAQKLPSSVRYCLDVNDMCVYDLGIPQEVIDNTQPSDILNTAREFHSNVARNDDWFALHVALLPCILGYYEIAINIIGDPKTERNTLYHTLWTVLNADVSYAKAYIQFVNDNLERYYTPEAMARWSKIFGDACDLEIKFFDVGRELPYPYTIVPPGCYKIINFRNHCALESPSNYYKLPQDNTTVQTGLKGIPVGHHRPIFTAPISDSDFQKWILEPTKNGYTLRNFVTREYASVRSERGKPVVVTSDDIAFWWINSMNVKYECAPTKYQFFVAASSQHALGVSGESMNINIDPLKWPNILEESLEPPVHPGPNQEEILGNANPVDKRFLCSPALAEMNYKGTSQMWILIACRLPIIKT